LRKVNQGLTEVQPFRWNMAPCLRITSSWWESGERLDPWRTSTAAASVTYSFALAGSHASAVSLLNIRLYSQKNPGELAVNLTRLVITHWNERGFSLYSVYFLNSYSGVMWSALFFDKVDQSQSHKIRKKLKVILKSL
jgi:hypothetical protein